MIKGGWDKGVGGRVVMCFFLCLERGIPLQCCRRHEADLVYSIFWSLPTQNCQPGLHTMCPLI